MRNNLTRASTLALMLLLSAAVNAARAQDIGLPIGTVPPAATVEDLDGKSVDLSQYVGKKPVLIEFWATWCPVCRGLEPKLHAAHQRFGDRFDILIVAVGVNQTPRSIKRHLESHPMPGPVFFDARGSAVRAYQAPTTSYLVILDKSGKVTYTGTGEDQDIVGALAKVVG